MRQNGGNKLKKKKPYTKPALTVGGKASELTAVGKTNAKNGGSSKKLYTKPTLTTYGTIRDLTATVGKTGPADGGKGSMSQTQLP
jgi:hypothetical protein